MKVGLCPPVFKTDSAKGEYLQFLLIANWYCVGISAGKAKSKVINPDMWANSVQGSLTLVAKV